MTVIDEFPAVCSLAVAPGGSLFGHGRQHLADVRGQEVVHFVALKRLGVKGQNTVLYLFIGMCGSVVIFR